MTKDTHPTRRSFLKSGALVAAPLAVVATPAAAAFAGDESKARLLRIEDERAIEALNRSFLRKFNRAGAERTGEFFASGRAPGLAPGLTQLALDPATEPERFELSEDGLRASGRYLCTVELQRALEGEDTLLQMARLQGNAAIRSSESRTLVADYVKREQGWAIETLRLA